MSNDTIRTVSMPFFVAIAAYLLQALPYLSSIGALPLAFLLAFAIRAAGYIPNEQNPLHKFMNKYLLKASVILYGVQLNIISLYNNGISFLCSAVIVIICSYIVILVLSRIFKVDSSLAMLIATGTAICGGAAIGAVSPILKSKRNDIALAVALISIIGTIFSLGAPLIEHWIQLSPENYGKWIGFSSHEIAHAALAGNYFGDQSLTSALMAKLSRVFMLFPVTLLLTWVMNRKNTDQQQKATFPYFILGFLAMSIISTLGFQYGFMTSELQGIISKIASFSLTLAMVMLALSIDPKALTKSALKPMIVVIISSTLVYSLSLLLI